MKVLFISSGKSGDVGEVVKNQGESLVRAGIKVDYFVIKPGFSGYVKAIPKIRKAYKNGNYDLAHAHYSLSAFAASMAGSFPLVVSLMGSDAYISGLMRFAARLFYLTRWSATIVKTSMMKKILKLKNAYIIPNGVDLDRFKPIPKELARKHLRYPLDKKLIVFISTPNRLEKNLLLAQQAVKQLDDSNIELMHIYDVANSEIPYFLNAAEALLLTSKWEGSVNVVKEAMACNCPVVSTDVGDVRWVIGNTEGCFLTTFNSEDVAEKIKAVLAFGKKTKGRERLNSLGLSSKLVADQIIEVYKMVLAGNA